MGIAHMKSLNIGKTSFKQFLMEEILQYPNIFMEYVVYFFNLGNWYLILMFVLEYVWFSSQEINLKQRSPAGSGKKNNALLQPISGSAHYMKFAGINYSALGGGEKIKIQVFSHSHRQHGQIHHT